MDKFMVFNKFRFLKLVVCGMMILCSTARVFATSDTYTWTGLALDGKWTSSGNWLHLGNPLGAAGYPGGQSTFLGGSGIQTADIVQFNAVLAGFSVTIPAGNAIQIVAMTVTGVAAILGPGVVNLSIAGSSTLGISNSLTVGQLQVITTVVLLPSLLNLTTLNITGTGTATLKGTVTVYTGGKLNLGATGVNTITNITGATVNLADFTDYSVLTALLGISLSNLLTGLGLTSTTGPSMNNAGTLTSSTSTFNLSGVFSSINNSGTFNANSSIFNLTGSNGAITNTSIFNLGTASIIYPTGASTLVSNSSPGIFTLKSDVSGTATIGAVGSTSSGLTGIFNVERYITGGGTLLNRGYRLLSSPVNQTGDVTTTSSTFGLFYLNNHPYGGVNYGGAFTAGPGGPTNGFNITNSNATIYLYDETLAYNNGSFTLGNHVPVNAINSTITGSGAASITTSTETLGTAPASIINIPVGNGFLMYFVGSNTSRINATTATPPDNTTLTANGHLNQGTFAIKLWTNSSTLSLTTSPVAAHPFPGYNMVGNPYACTIDLSKVISDNSSIDNIYLLSALNSPNQFYKAFTAHGTSAPPAQGYAISGEGFFVHATGPGKTLTFSESEKVPTIQLVGTSRVMALKPQALTQNRKLSVGSNSLSAVEPQSNTLTGLYMKIAKDSLTYNYCGIYFSKDWSDTYAEDDALDLNSPTGIAVMSSLSSDHIRLAVNHMPDYTKGVNVKLFASASTDGLYNLSIEGIRNIDTLYDIYLIDHYKTDSLDICRYKSYAFNIMKADTNSYGANRFELSIRPRPLPAYKLLNLTAQKVSAGVQVSWKTEAEGNYTGFVLQKQDGTTVQFNPLYSKQGDGSGTYSYIDTNPVTPSDTYRLQQSDIVGNLSYSSPVTISYSPLAANGTIMVYPNPARNIINLTINQASATANIQADAVSSSSQTTGGVSYGIRIISITGSVVKETTSGQPYWQNDVSSLTPGTYIIQVVNNKDESLVGKSIFVKM
jgi:hypothetical protein